VVFDSCRWVNVSNYAIYFSYSGGDNYVGNGPDKTKVVNCVFDFRQGMGSRAPENVGSAGPAIFLSIRRSGGNGTQQDFPQQVWRNNIYLVPPGQTTIYRLNGSGSTMFNYTANQAPGASNNATYNTLLAAGLDSNYKPLPGSIQYGAGIHFRPGFTAEGRVKTNPPNRGCY
jgi:hypothetical protein